MAAWIQKKTLTLIDLPDLILVNILQYIKFADLILVVNRTCKRLNTIVKENSRLWRHLYFEHPITLNKEQLDYVLRHSNGFSEFSIPHATFSCLVPDIDSALVHRFFNAKKLYWLDLTECKLSTLCFLEYLPNLEILNVSECLNLVDDDFHAITYCKKLDHLYVSFSAITPSTVVSITNELRLTVLDVSGIKFSLEQCRQLFESSYETLLFVNISLNDSESAQGFERLLRYYIDCNIVRKY